MAIEETILIIDDHQLIVDIVGSYINSAPGLRAVGATSVPEAMNVVTSNAVVDVVLCDLFMPGQDDVKSYRKLIEAAGDTPVVLFSGDAPAVQVRKAFDMGFRGYIPKDTHAQTLVNALRLILSGESYLPYGSLSDLDPKIRNPDVLQRLDEYEQDVLEFMVSGLSDARIAKKLGQTQHAVNMAVKSIYKKLQVPTRRRAVAMALSA